MRPLFQWEVRSERSMPRSPKPGAGAMRVNTGPVPQVRC